MPLIGRENFKKLTDQGYESANNEVRSVYFSGLFNIIKGTPVDEGRARNNWFLSVGTPSSNSTTSKSEGLSTIRSLRTMPNRVFNRKIYFTNNLPYIETLEYGGYPDPVKLGTYNKKSKKYEKRSIGGFSKQAKVGWVRVILIKMRNKIRAL